MYKQVFTPFLKIVCIRYIFILNLKIREERKKIFSIFMILEVWLTNILCIHLLTLFTSHSVFITIRGCFYGSCRRGIDQNSSTVCYGFQLYSMHTEYYTFKHSVIQKIWMDDTGIWKKKSGRIKCRFLKRKIGWWITALQQSIKESAVLLCPPCVSQENWVWMLWIIHNTLTMKKQQRHSFPTPAWGPFYGMQSFTNWSYVDFPTNCSFQEVL